MEFLFSLSISILILSSTTAAAVSTSPATNTTTPPLPTTTTSTSTLDPKQLRALQSLNIPTTKDPCTQPSYHNATTCDTSTPFRHLTSLLLSNCSDDTSLYITALKSLSTLTSLTFLNCPITTPIHFPSTLTSNLHSFTSINSLKKLTGVFLSRLQNLTDLTISGVTITASGPSIILSNLKLLHSLTISNTTLSGYLPKHFKNLNFTHIDLSNNKLKSKIPTSLTLIKTLQTLNLSSNRLTGELPFSFGNLLSLQNLSLSSNSLSGPLPSSMAAMSVLVHLDLGSNQFNGTIPTFITEMKGLKYLNLEKNNFHGVMPFNASFIKKLEVFKIGGNENLCYNLTTIPPKVKLEGIAPCDKHGMPVPPPPVKDPGEVVGSSDGGGGSSGGDGDDSLDDSSGGDDEGEKKQEQRTHGPSKVVLGVAIGLSSIVFLIVFLVLLSKWCG